MFYQMLNSNPFRHFTQLPGVHCHASESPEREVEETESWTPCVDVLETAEAFRLVCEVPGLDAGAIDLSVEKGVLSVTGEAKNGISAEGVKVLRSERPHGKFARTFVLPRGVDASAIKASCNAGVLEITLPKSSELQPRKVEIAGA